MISAEEQKNLLLDIARKLKREITTFAIGGTAMLFLGLKDSTKDIDLVFTKEEDRKDFIEAARKIGWTNLNSAIVYGRKENKPIMLKFGDSRLDLFVRKVIYFEFSEEMQKRAIKTRQFEKNLLLKIADMHDIILMKCATDRIKDIDDAKTIIENTEIDFDILFREAKNQLSLGKERTALELGYFLEKLKSMKVDIPNKILDDLWPILQKQIKEKGKEFKKEKRLKKEK